MSRTTDQWEQLLEGTTPGPWKWDDDRVPTLHGRGGTSDTYEYEVEVLEADHNGECGCRSACDLELNVSNFDKELIAAAPDLARTVIEQSAQIKRLQAALMAGPEEIAGLNAAVIRQLIDAGIITAEDMEDTDE